MAQFQEFLAALDHDPGNVSALARLEDIGPELVDDEGAQTALEKARKSLRQRGALEVVAKLFDVEIRAVSDDGRRADLLLEKGQLLAEDLLHEAGAVECFNKVLEIRPDDEAAQETLANFDLFRENWQRFVDKYLEEAKVSTDRGLTTSMYLSAAKTYARYQPGSKEVEEYFRRALEADPRNRDAAVHLERLLRKDERWQDLYQLLEQRAEVAAPKDERVHALVGIADVARNHLDKLEVAVECMKKVLALEPSHPRALMALSNAYEAEEDWSGLVLLYTNALKAQRRAGSREGDLGLLLQVAMIHWKRIDNSDTAEEYFRRVRKVEPAHPAALGFYREFYPARGEAAKLLQVLRQALKAADTPERKRELSVEMAELSENQLGNPEKAIDSWKQILRAQPDSEDARAALRRLYRRTEGWNKLLDLMKEDVERLPKDDIAGRVERLLEVVEIYRDRLKLDVMVINTYNAILKLDPHNARAIDDLATKYKELGRWNDLIGVLSKKADDPRASVSERVAMLREMADLWSERFGNYAQAIKPLEQLIELSPGDLEARNRLKDIYTRRRQWRALISLLGTEASQQPIEARRDALANMARLGSERLGDFRLAIELWNRVIELPTGDSDAEAVGALAALYEREKRYLPLAEIYGRQVVLAGDDSKLAIAALEKQGSLLADRLAAPVPAAEAFRAILKLDPSHGRAMRTLRELYATARDFDALEAMYAELDHWDELVDILSSVADRIDEPAEKLALLERAGRTASQHSTNKEREARAWERVLGADPNHLGAAKALAPIYQATSKWARLLSTYESILSHAEDKAEKLALHRQICQLAEHHLGSKSLAFQWTAQAFELEPNDDELLRELERLGAEADAWDEVAVILDRRAKSDAVDDQHRLHLYRELGKISMVRLHQPEQAREYQQKVLKLAPDDSTAIAALEEIATQLSDWPDLLAVYRRRVKTEEDADARVELMFRIAFIEEERLADLDAAAISYIEILEHRPASQRAMRALAKIQEARGDWNGLALVLDQELGAAGNSDEQFDLLMRLGRLYQDSLERPVDALDRYKRALAVSNHRRECHEALESFLGDGAPDDAARVEVAGLLLPIYEGAEDQLSIARAVEVLRGAATGEEALAHDRRLVDVYGDKLGDSARAYDAALRVLAQAPDDRENRALLLAFSTALEKESELAESLSRALVATENGDVAPQERQLLAAELASLYDDVLDDTDKAEKAWVVVLELEPGDVSAYDALDRIFRGAERWEDLRDLLVKREDNTLDGDLRRDILLQICDLDEGVLSDAEGAIIAYRKVLSIDPTFLRAYKALERLLEDKERWDALEKLLGEELDYVEDQEHIDLTYKRARVRARRLLDLPGAVDLLEDVVTRQRGHADGRELLEELLPEKDLRLRIACLLEPLYEGDGLWKDLTLVLRARNEFASSPHESVELLGRIATVEEVQIGNERAAFDTWIEAMNADPGAADSRLAVMRLGSALDRWSEVSEAFEGVLRARDDGDVSLRAEILGQLAETYDVHQADVAQAIGAYKRLLDLDPGNPDTAQPAAIALDRLYSEEQRWSELVEVVRLQSEWVSTPEERKELLARIAVISEEQLEDKVAAVAAWRELGAEDPEDPRALDALERLFTEADQHRELIEILRRRVEIASEPDDRKQGLRRIAFLYEEQLEEPSEAITSHLEVLDHVPDDRETLAQLARLYRSGARWMDLYEIIERQLVDAQGSEEQVELTHELGVLCASELERIVESLERMNEVLSIDPAHESATKAVEAMLQDDDYRLRAAEILEPLYSAGGDWDKLARLLEQVAASVDDPRERLRQLTRVAELSESELGDKPAAFAHYGKAVRVAVAEPELPQLLEHLDRLAAELGEEDALISVYEAVAPDVLDGDLQRRLYLDIADLSRALRDDISMARDYYQRVLDSAPDDTRALHALESIYREAGEHERLYEVLIRKVEMAEAAEGTDDNYEARILALSEAAQLCVDQLNRTDDGVMAWEQVLEIAPDNKDAGAALEKLYQGAERWHDLVGLVERRLGFAFTVEEAVALRFRLGQIYERELLDPDAAVENYSAALGGEPGHEGATVALERALDDPGTRSVAAEVLEPIYVSQQDWPKLVRIYEIKLDAAEEPNDRLQLTRYIARLYEEQLEDLEGAFRWYGRVFREDPADRGVRDQLGRLATILESWDGLANVYQEYLDDEPGEVPEAVEVALAVAELYDHRTGDVELGQAAYRRVLQGNPDDHDTFAKLEAMLSRAERWFALVEVYEEISNATMDDERRQELSLRMARVFRDSLKNPGSATESYRAVLEINPDHAAANDELDALYEVESQWYELADLLTNRIGRAMDAAAQNRLRMRLATVREQRLEDVQGAIDQFDEVLMAQDGETLALPELERLILNVDARERIADILEPVYRRNDWWQKLVVILDARLQYVDDAEQRVTMLREIAQIHESRGGDEGLALKALAAAWKSSPVNDAVRTELTELAAKLEAWDELVETLESGIADNYDYDLVAVVLAEIAEIQESKRGDNRTAIQAWTRVLDVADEEPNALAALDRLYTAVQDWPELGKVVQRRAERVDDDADRVALLHRVAALQETQLANVGAAIEALKAVLMVADSDAQALDALERLYRAQQDWTELAATLGRKIELATDPQVRRGLHLVAAEVADKHQNDAYEAISQLSMVLEEDPSDGEAMAELDRIYAREKMWNELVEIVDRRVELESAPEARAELGFRAAKVVELEMLDPEQSLERYGAVLEQVPSHGGARDALDALARGEDTLERAASLLERVYGAEGNHDAIADLYERRLAAPTQDLDLRRQQYVRLVEIHEISLGDLDAAFGVLARALAETPEDEWVAGELDRVAAARGSWEALADLYQERLAETMDAELEYKFASKAASIHEEALGDLDAAAEKYRQALEVANDEREPLAALDRIYGRAQNHNALAEILAREADATMDDAEQAEFLFRLGDLREQQLSAISEAVLAYRDVLERAPGHAAARGALERLMSQEQERSEIIGILEPLYEGEGDFGRLADLLTAKLSVTDDSFERAQIYARVAEISEGQLADPVRALDAAGGWLAEDPRSEDALANVERLGEVCNRWDEVAARLQGIIESSGDDDVRRPLMLKLGDVQLTNQGSPEHAELTYISVLELDPESAAALAALDGIYRGRGDLAKLADVVWRRGQMAFDADQKRGAFVEVAGLREQLGDGPGAIEAWREVMDLEEGDRDAHTRLAVLYEQAAAWQELIDLLSVSARFAANSGQEASLRMRIAELYQNTLQDLESSVDAWQAVLDVESDSPMAIEALLAVHAQREDWLSVQDVLTRKLDLAKDDRGRVEIFTALADLAANQRDAADDAIGYLYQIVDIDNAHFDTYKRLEAVLTKAERWHDLVEVLEREGDVYGTLGHSVEEVACLARAADVFEGPLDNPDAAGELLEKILRREPNYVPALTRLSKLYEGQGDWDKCSEVLQRAAQLGPSGSDAADLYFRLGEVERQKTGDPAAAREYWTQALGYDANHEPSVAAFEEIARADEDWSLVADMVGRRLNIVEDPAAQLELTLELAELHRVRLGQPQQVIPLLEKAAKMAPDDVRVLGPLADLYFAAGDHGRAGPIYERLADEAKKKRKMKDVARYRQRLGGILEAQGDIDGALVAYEEAFRVNPTNTETMAGLGRIYLSREVWDKARRVYRSMVLQNLDPALGITKAEVYYSLGMIHQKMDEPNKAKGMFQRGLELEPDNAKLRAALESL